MLAGFRVEQMHMKGVSRVYKACCWGAIVASRGLDKYIGRASHVEV